MTRASSPEQQPIEPRDGRPPVLAVGRTDPGRVRAQNEDAYAIHDDLGLFVVADGMGGQQAGAFAATVVAKVLPLRFGTLGGEPSASSQAVGKVLGLALEAVSADLRGRAATDPAIHGAGAAVVACAVTAADALIAHMGDSRAYLVRNGRLVQLTADHTVAALLTSLGQLPASRARQHPGRNVLTRYAGADEASAGADLGLLALVPGDRILLCTDGLTKVVADREIAETVVGEPTIEAAVDRLIAAANAGGGPDNVTALLIQYGPVPPPAAKARRRIVISRTSSGLLQPFGGDVPSAAPTSGEPARPEVEREAGVSPARSPGARVARSRKQRGSGR